MIFGSSKIVSIGQLCLIWKRMIVFDVYYPIFSGSLYLSLTAFFESCLLKFTFCIGRTVCSTRGCHAKMKVVVSSSDRVFHIVNNSSHTAVYVVPNIVTCCIAMGNASLM